MPETSGNKLVKILPIFVLLCLTIIFLNRLVSFDFITIGHVEDHIRLLYPYRAFDAEQMRALSIPQWNPYTFSGFPYLASFRCHIFYPVNLLFLILPTHTGMNFSIVFHIFLAGLFMYLLALSLGMDRFSSMVSAIVFMFSGFLIDEVWWGHETVLGSIVWTPLVFLLLLKAVKKRKFMYSALAGLVFAIQVFSGHPQFPFYGIMALFFFVIYLFLYSLKKEGWKKALIPVFCFLIIIFIGLGLVAIQLFPAAELSQHSIRSFSEDTFSFFTRWSMHPSYLLTFVFPRLAPIIGTYSFPFPISLGYTGILALLLAAMSLFLIRNKYVLFFWILTFLSLLMTSGKYTPFYGLFYRFFPGFNAFRNPIFLIYLYVFSVSVLAGFGIFYLKENIWKQSERKLKTIGGLLIACGLVLIIIASIVFSMVPPESISDSHTTDYLRTKIQKYRDTLIYDFATIGIFLLLAVIPLIFPKRFRIRDVFFKAIIFCLIFLDLMLYGTKFIHTYDLTPFVSKRKWIDFLKNEKKPFRVLPILDYPEQDPVLKLNKISSINGYGSLEISQDYVDFIAAFQEQPVTQDACLMRVANYDSTAVNILNTKFILTTKDIEDDRFPLVYTDDIPAAQTWDPHRKDTVKLKIYENRSALPRAFIVHSVRVVKKREYILEMLKDPNYDPRSLLILEEEPKKSLDNDISDKEEGQVEFLSYKENELILKASLPKSGFLFLSEMYYPGWKAFVNGEERKIYRANYLFRSIYLDEGVHTVRFIFNPFSFKIGALIAALTLFALLLFFIIHIFRRRRLTNLDS